MCLDELIENSNEYKILENEGEMRKRLSVIRKMRGTKGKELKENG